MDASSPNHSSGARRGHLKRLSLSVVGQQQQQRETTLLGHDYTSSSHSTPDKSAQYASTSSASPSLMRNGGAGESSASPLRRSLNGNSNGRRRPMSMSVSSGYSSPLSGNSLLLLSEEQPSSSTSSILAVSDQPPSAVNDPMDNDADNQLSHPLAASTPTHEEPLSPGSSTASPSLLRNSAGRRSILGRSARRQSSISYARSPVNDNNNSINNSPHASLRTSLGAIKDEGEEEGDENGSVANISIQQSHQSTPSRPSLAMDRSAGLSRTSDTSTEGHAQALGTSPSSITEMSIGPGARSSDLLTFIAKKERKCLDLREELAKQEAELAALKKKWESVIQREMAASTTSASSSSNLHTSPASQSTSIFSTLASTLNASAGQSPVKSLTGSGQDATFSPSSSRAQSNSNGSRRLLTNRHSISVSPASSSMQNPPYFGGGSDLSPQTSPSPINESNQQVAPLDVQKLAKSWLGGVMKSATTVLDSLAPPPSNQDLGTVAEEDEEEEDQQQQQQDGQRYRRTTASHPTSVARSRSPHDRNGSTATVLSEMSSPSSSCEDGQFSSAASRSSSVSSLHSENGKDDSNDRDITPVATPVLPHDTPRANGSTNNAEEGDLWALSGGEFEDSHDRERREDMERDRLSSPPRGSSATTAAPRRPANHGRRRSTAFELGGAWGAMVGKKWSEVTSQLSASETFKTSSKKAMGIMEGFERSLTEAITPDANDANNSNNTQLMLVNGELIPTGDWSPVSSPRQEQKEKDRDSLPSGIGGPASWSALLARTNSRSSNSSSNNSRSPKVEQQQDQWMNHDDLLSSGDLGQNTLSPSSNNSARLSRSLLDDDNDEYVVDTQQQNQRSSTLSPTPTTAQERLQASRAKHAKRMSMPVNSVSASHPLASPQPRGLGLENVNETEEDNDAWGW